MPFIDNQGAKIYWDELGEGEPVLLIMGLGYPSGHVVSHATFAGGPVPNDRRWITAAWGAATCRRARIRLR